MGVSSGLVEHALAKKAPRETQVMYLKECKHKYNNSTDAFKDNPVRNRGLQPDARYTSDGDHMSALLLHTNLS